MHHFVCKVVTAIPRVWRVGAGRTDPRAGGAGIVSENAIFQQLTVQPHCPPMLDNEELPPRKPQACGATYVKFCSQQVLLLAPQRLSWAYTSGDQR